jgi:FlaA1/EpsC-like NDP-sugar epimerase
LTGAGGHDEQKTRKHDTCGKTFRIAVFHPNGLRLMTSTNSKQLRLDAQARDLISILGGRSARAGSANKLDLEDRILLNDKIALVTGSTHNIGLAIVRSFAREGAKVIVHSRHEDDAKKVADEIKGDHCVADVSKPEQVAARFERIKERTARPDRRSCQ